ncbi:protein BTN1-like [Stylophora pistillata]|uniref:protein BTN1-like n=1 Tax=Stylophora pistillata TaxID=50429 RepID=UPI000C04FCEA|nr:protein BTN1-like [Stylophora pistillata]
MGNFKAKSVDHNGGYNLKNNHKPEHERLRKVVAFFGLGIILYAFFSLVIVAAQDILAETYLPTSVVLIANVAPAFLVSLITPYLRRIPYVVRIFLVFFLSETGVIVLALAGQVHWKLIGVGMVSVGLGLGEPTILSLTSFHGELTLTAFSAGTGVGFAIAPLYYTALTTWACVSPKVTTLISAAMMFLILVCYYFIHKSEEKRNCSPSDDHIGVPYSALETNENLCVTSDKDDEENGEEASLSWGEKIMVIRELVPHMLTLFITIFSEYLIIQAVITTLAFPSSPFKPRDHYEYYILVFTVGEVVGRSYLAVLSCIKEDWGEKVKFPYLWVLCLVQVMDLAFLALAAWYRFLPSVWIVLPLVFVSGAAVGTFYVNVVMIFRNSIQQRFKEFAMGHIELPLAGGVLTAAMLGLYIEPLLREHCMILVDNKDFCFTRTRSFDRFSSSCFVKHD